MNYKSVLYQHGKRFFGPDVFFAGVFSLVRFPPLFSSPSAFRRFFFTGIFFASVFSPVVFFAGVFLAGVFFRRALYSSACVCELSSGG